MALTVAFKGYGNVTLAESTTGYDSITITAPELWSEIIKQGNGAIGFQASGKDGAGLFELGTGLNFNTTYLGQHIFMWVNFTTPGTLIDNTTGGGMYLLAGSSQTDYLMYKIADRDFQDQIGKGFGRFVFDPTKTPTTTVGTPDLTAITMFGVWVDGDLASRADNLFIDRIDVGFGLTVKGTSTQGWKDIVIEDALIANKYGILQNEQGIYFAYGGIEIGDNVATDETIFSDIGRKIQFISQHYYTSITGTVTAPLIANGFLGVSLVDNGTGKTEFTDGIIVGADNGRSGSLIIGSELHNTKFDASALTNALSFIKLYNTKFEQLKGGLVLHDDADSLFYGGVVDQCEQMDAKRTVIRNATISGYSGTLGALLWNENIDIESSAFIANTDLTNDPAAIEMPSAVGDPYSFNALSFSGNDYDVDNTSGTDITVNKLGGSNPATYDPTGNVVTYTASFTLTLTNLVEGTQVTIVNSSTRVELQNTIVSATGVVTYPHSGGETVDILLMNLDYDPNLSDIYDLLLPNSDNTIKFQEIDDLNFNNPA